mmetsp:Transcript_7325/g.12402  ORF Transcript_7325/g.12402 Transcript_7325/m.12402 type:complete len:608 (-) Transcript_7325:44-1867(-)
MGKKKSFIDKKTANVYHVVRRSQRDVGTEATADTLSDFVLMPSPENAQRELTREQERQHQVVVSQEGSNVVLPNKKTTNNNNFADLKDHIARAGLLDQTATTYSKYTKPIKAGGLFVPSDNEYAAAAVDDGEFLTDTSKNHLDTALQEAMEIHEVGRMLDSIALTPDCMDEDMAHALFDEFEEGEFEEILDDFCFTANQDVLEEEDGGNTADGGGGGEFNFEQHVQMLMEKARAQENGGGVGGREMEEDFFGGMTPLHEREEEDDDEDHYDYDQYGEEEEEDSFDGEFNDEAEEDYARPIGGEQQRILCQKFEEALLEYDSDDVGDLDEECEEIVGSRHLEGDAQLEAALNEFLTEKEDDVLIEGTKKDDNKKRTGGSGFSALVDKRMVHASELDKDVDPSKTLLVNIEESKKQMQADLADADAILANPEMDLPPEEILIDGKSYFSQTSRNPWDCESILSTYSNLDNNPVVIGRSKKRKGKKKIGKDLADEESRIPEEEPVQIKLSNKTGLPLGVFDNYNQSQSPEEDHYGYGETDTFLSVNRGEARNKQESNMDKKVRKLTVKEERKICRMQKKMMKEAFKDEFQKRGTAEVVDAVGGASVFRYT